MTDHEHWTGLCRAFTERHRGGRVTLSVQRGQGRHVSVERVAHGALLEQVELEPDGRIRVAVSGGLGLVAHYVEGPTSVTEERSHGEARSGLRIASAGGPVTHVCLGTC
jgi:hypothetical protein